MSPFVRLFVVCAVAAAVQGCSPSSASNVDVIDDVVARLQALYAERPAATPQEVAAVLATRSELSEVGSDENGAWATFADGRVFAVLDDRLGDDEDTVGQPLDADERDTFPMELPTRDDVRIVDTLGSRFIPYWKDFEPWFTRQGFRTGVVAGTVEELKNVSGQAVLYITSHGGRMKSRGGEIPVISTSTPVAPGFDLLYGDDLDEKALVYLTVRNERLADGTFKVTPVYGITDRFVAKYMALQPDSLVVVDACVSLSPELVQAFMAQGASLYGGWSASVSNRHSQQTIKFFFDRLLGANEFRPVTPPQRPFNYVDVLADMRNRGLDLWPSSGGRLTEFSVLPSSAQSLGLLVPSLKHVRLGWSADEQWLVLNGSFGTMPSKVLFNGFPLSCSDWYQDFVLCTLRSTQAGTVVVETNEPRKSQSNTRTLNEWKSTFTLTAKEGCGPGTPRSLVATIRANVRFRADVDGFRPHSGDELAFDSITFDVEPAPTVFASGTGDCTYSTALGSETTRWSGTGEAVWDDDHSVGVVELANRRIRLHLRLDSRGVIQFVTVCNGTVCSRGDYNVAWNTGDEGFQDAEDPWAEAVFDIPMDELLNGAARTRVGPTPADFDVPQVTVSWTALKATLPPDPTAAR